MYYSNRIITLEEIKKINYIDLEEKIVWLYHWTDCRTFDEYMSKLKYKDGVYIFTVVPDHVYYTFTSYEEATKVFSYLSEIASKINVWDLI